MSYPQLTFHHTTFASESFIARKRKVVFENTIPYQLQVLKDVGTYDAYKLQWKDGYRLDPETWIPRDFHLFWDSDIGKWVEGACYALHDAGFRDSETGKLVERAIGELVEMIEKAQEEDGYLNIHYQVVEPENRFSNLRDMHELYNCGHLIEAAIAHQALFDNDRLMNVLLKYVDLLCRKIGPDQEQIHGYSGHPEIELALMRLHSITKEPKHLALAQYLIDERGKPRGANDMHFFVWEARCRDERPYERPDHYPMKRDFWYQQADVPIIEQSKVEGHAVRAMYLYTGVADYLRKSQAGEESPHDYTKSLQRLWSNMVEKRMYLTGGVGSMHQWEGFGTDYFLPQSLDEGGCYSETCAAVGVMMWAQRMLQVDLNSQYADVMELCFYNAVLGGMSCDGKTFAYENALASCDASLCRREKWFTCACCPPNVSRLLASIGGYLWDYQVDVPGRKCSIRVHMFETACLSVAIGDSKVHLHLDRDKPSLPWSSSVTFKLDAPDEVNVDLQIRIPAWATSWEITPNLDVEKINRGYLSVPSSWLWSHPDFTLSFSTSIRVLSPHPYTNQNTVTLAQGPLIYCVEDFDNEWVTDHFKTLLFRPSQSKITEKEVYDEATGETYTKFIAAGGIALIVGPEAARTLPGWPSGHAPEPKDSMIQSLTFVPFYYRANRGGRGHMRTGIRKP